MSVKKDSKLADALKVLDESPRRIHRAYDETETALAYMKDPNNRRRYSEIQQKNYNDATREQLVATVRKENAKIAEALAYVRSTQGKAPEGIDLNDTRLQNAISITKAMGKDLTGENQISMLESLRGDPAALHFVSKLFGQFGLYYGENGKRDLAAQMTAPIDDYALQTMEEYVAFNDYDPQTDHFDKIRWTHGAFRSYAEQQGLVSDGDAVYNQLAAMRQDATTDAERGIISNGLYEMRSLDGDNATLGAKCAIFDKAMRALDAERANPTRSREDEQAERVEAAVYRIQNDLPFKATAPDKDSVSVALNGGAPTHMPAADSAFTDNDIRRAVGLAPRYDKPLDAPAAAPTVDNGVDYEQMRRWAGLKSK